MLRDHGVYDADECYLMTPHYYHILRRKSGEDVVVSDDVLRVNLTSIRENDHITDDTALLEAMKSGDYFYLSGGGSVLVNGRYLLVVQREATARVNPGQFSLFTGRADGPQEWECPTSVLRELFEELLLYRQHSLLKPRIREWQALIDQTYQKDARTATGSVELRPIPVQNRRFTLTKNAQVLYEGEVFSTVSLQGDINLLYLFACDIPLQELSAKDGEGKRELYVLDLLENRYASVAELGERVWQSAEHLPMSFNLNTLYEYLKKHRSLWE